MTAPGEEEAMSYTVHLFPGQGDFAVSALLRATAVSGPLRRAVAEVFEEVDEVAHERGLRPLGPWLLGDSPPTTRALAQAETGTQQLALFGTSVAVHRALSRRRGAPPDAVLGVSFGEIAALTAAGAFTVADGAAVAHDLAVVLTSCPGGLTVLACDEPRARSLLRAASADAVAVACVNDDTETVVSGPLGPLEDVEEQARDAGIGCARLRLPFSSHHPALTVQAGRFARRVRAYPVRATTCPVHSAVAGRAYEAHDDLALGLADCLVRPARLPDVLHRLDLPHGPDGLDLPHGPDGAGEARFYEAGTGRALSLSVARVLAAREPTVISPLAETGHDPALLTTLL
ncbi:acyltransferase domain-containing protein [Streptomyces sp. NPDC051567]|uniref:acyltransferase domain-containing protein n=1 Tax=Streptomyces sp. NPDC051567 TaxID=3365660 RepID=UPI003795E5BA